MAQAEFMGCTPVFFEEMCRQERTLRRYSERQLAELTATVINWSYGRPEQPAQADWYMLTGPEDLAEPEDFDVQIARTMERAFKYQAGQVARGIN